MHKTTQEHSQPSSALSRFRFTIFNFCLDLWDTRANTELIVLSLNYRRLV